MIHTSTVHGRGNSASDFQSTHQYNDVLIRKKILLLLSSAQKKVLCWRLWSELPKRGSTFV